jgi:Tfp pilus assembly protein PilN
MAKGVAGPWPVIEWSAGSLTLYDPVSRQTGTVSADMAGSTLGGRPVIVAISRRSAFVRTTRLPDAPKAEVARILQLQIDKLFPLASSNAAIDFVLTADRNVEGRLAIVAATPAETLARVREELGGLNIERIVPAALGAIPVATALGQAHIAIVQDNSEGLAIDLVDNGLLIATRVVPQPASAGEIEAEVHRSWAMSKVEPGPTAAVGGLVFDGADYSSPMSTLAALSLDPPDIDLELPQTVAERETKRIGSKKNLAMLLWAAAIGVGAVVFDWRQTEMNRVEQSNKVWEARTKELRDTQALAQTKEKKLDTQDATLVASMTPKQYVGDVATLFTTVVPKNLWLTGLTIERGKQATVRGYAMTHEAVSAYLESLGSLDRFRDVKLNFMTDSDIAGTPVVSFSVAMHVIGNYPLPEDMKKPGGKK